MTGADTFIRARRCYRCRRESSGLSPKWTPVFTLFRRPRLASTPSAPDQHNCSSRSVFWFQTLSITADVVVIGGGINDVALLMRLRTAVSGRSSSSKKDISLGGPSGRSNGVVRQHYSHQTLAAMTRDSVESGEFWRSRWW